MSSIVTERDGLEIRGGVDLSEDRLVSTRAAGEILGMSEEWVRLRCKDGQVRGFKMGSHWKIPTEELRRILAGGL